MKPQTPIIIFTPYYEFIIQDFFIVSSV
jgi:hypothetical protein